MAYEIREEQGLLVLRFIGTISSEDLKESLARVEELEARESRAPNRITDLSKSDAEGWTLEVVRDLAEHRRQAVLKNNVKSAIFAPGDLQFGYSSMFAMLNDNPRIEVAVFRDAAQAALWLGCFKYDSRGIKVAQPGATDNPDDAQRLREDH